MPVASPQPLAPQDVGTHRLHPNMMVGWKIRLDPRILGVCKAVRGQAGPPASSACQAALSPSLGPGATPCTQPKHQSIPQPPRRGCSCQPSLSTASAAFSGLARALPGLYGAPPSSPFYQPPPPPRGRGNAAPGVGHSELGDKGHSRILLPAHAKGLLGQTPRGAALGWLRASRVRDVDRGMEPDPRFGGQ